MPEPELIEHDPATGEIIETQAADGGQRYPSVTTLTDLINMMNDGQFNYDCADPIAKMAEEMEEIGVDTGAKVKGKLVLTVEVERSSDGIYFFTPAIDVKLPKPKGKRTIGWVTGDNRFTPNKPNQGNLFGTIRDVSAGTRSVRN